MRTADDSTHPIQLYAISIACAANLIGLAVINRHKRRKQVGRAWSWELRRDAFWALMAVLLAIEVWLDSRYPISTHMLPIKAYSFAFSVGLLDLFFSDTRGVPLKVIAGPALCVVSVNRVRAGAALWLGSGLGIALVIGLG